MISRHAKADRWRRSLGLSLDELAKLTGYARVTLYWYFRGLTPPRTKRNVAGQQESKPIEAPEWKRFTNICAGVDAQIRNRKAFNWGE